MNNTLDKFKENTLSKLCFYCLFFIVLLLPFTGVPKKFAIPVLGANLSLALAKIIFFLFCIWFFKQKEILIPFKKFWTAILLWFALCTFIGSLTYPFYDPSFLEHLRSAGLYGKLVKAIPEVFDNEKLMVVKFSFFKVREMIINLIIPFAGIFALIYYLVHVNSHKVLHIIGKASLMISIVMELYSIPEIIWIWTGNKACENFLKAVNVFFYDPVIGHGWWPPLLWKNQLRSVTPEPSFFGILAMFLIPFLWYRVFEEHKKREIVFLLLFTLMIFMTGARTAIVCYLGELALLIIATVGLKISQWKKIIGTVLAVSVISFGISLYGGTAAHGITQSYNHLVSSMTQKQAQKPASKTPDKNQKPSAQNKKKNQQPPAESKKKAPAKPKSPVSAKDYVNKNITSLASINARSNAARWGNTIARIKVGLQHPIFGVGYHYESKYMIKEFPPFALKSLEAKGWIKEIKNDKLFEVSIPVSNQYSEILSDFGIPGLILFMVPIFYVLYLLYKVVRVKKYDNRLVYVFVAFMGQVACMLSNHFFMTYPLILALIVCLLITDPAYQSEMKE